MGKKRAHMIKSVGILTFHRVFNHGAVLQAYALQRTIEKLGMSPVIVDLQLPRNPFYKPSEMNEIWQARCSTQSPKRDATIKRWLKSVVAKNSGSLLTARAQKRFVDFQNRFLRLSPVPFPNPEFLYKTPPALDAFITGSDQVWNPEIGARWSPEPFFLTFAPKNIPRIAYAPSFGTSYLAPQFHELYRKWLNEMDHLSCREAEGAYIINEICGRDANVVVDPTLLLSAEEWRDISNPPSISEPYIFCYSVGSNDSLMKACVELKRETGLPVFKIGRTARALIDCMDTNAHVVLSAGPQEFLGYLRNASLVVTNSFHGTALSINLRKPFVFVPAQSQATPSRLSRITNLLRQLRLQGQVITPGSGIGNILWEIDYTEAHAILKDKSSESLSFLKRALNIS